jgi:arylsulfatase A-like enzyme
MNGCRLARLGVSIGCGTVVLAGLTLGDGAAAPLPSKTPPERPDIIIITVDTLRADRLGSYGYARKTTPHLDELLASGILFANARVVEPLTNPSLCSMMTSMYPQDHGASRNGLRMRPGLDSLPRVLEDYGYMSVAFVGNWTLRNKLSGLGEHFEQYIEVLNRKRWAGFLRSEASAEDLTDSAMDWLDDYLDREHRGPFVLWVHYVDPHAPYRLHEQFAERLAIPTTAGKTPPQDRYDTEVAFVDQEIGRLLRRVHLRLSEPPLIVFASDHGESLGEHGYWGHGRNLREPGLWIPMGLSWKGHVEPAVVSAPALNIDLAPTVLGLLDVQKPQSFRGFDWTDVFQGQAAPMGRITHYQAHRGAVISKHESNLARRKGLLAVALIDGTVKEVWRIDRQTYQVWDLETDALERRNLAGESGAFGTELRGWMDTVAAGLTDLDVDPVQPLDDASAQRLKDLGYVD